MPQNAAINSRFLTQKNTGQVVSSLHMLPPRILVFSYTTAAKHSNTVQQDRQNTFTQGPILGESKPSITNVLCVKSNCFESNYFQRFVSSTVNMDVLFWHLQLILVR